MSEITLTTTQTYTVPQWFIRKQTFMPKGNNYAEINRILDRMEHNCLDVNEIMNCIREIRELTK